jgi:STE24 endopeptidase
MADTSISNASLTQPSSPGGEMGQPRVQLNSRRQEEARLYARLNRYLFAANLVVGALYLLFALITGFSFWLKEWAQSLTSSTLLVVALYALAFFLIYIALITPLNFIGGYVWPHRFGLSKQGLAAWAWDYVKGLTVGLVFMLMFIQILYILLRVSPEWWWLWMSVFYLLFIVVLTNLAPLILVPMFYKLEPLEDVELVERLTALADRAGARVKNVCKMDLSSKTTTANAALMGLGNTRQIVLGDTLLEDYSEDEIETILAHELGHHVHRDVETGILVESVTTLLALWLANMVLRGGLAAFGFDGIADIAAFPLFGLILGLFAVMTMPLNNSYSRWRERLADQYALEITRKPEAFITAMTRLANQNLAEADPARWVEVMLYSHPAISRRLAMARDFETENGAATH